MPCRKEGRGRCLEEMKPGRGRGRRAAKGQVKEEVKEEGFDLGPPGTVTLFQILGEGVRANHSWATVDLPLSP